MAVTGIYPYVPPNRARIAHKSSAGELATLSLAAAN
jgi:hypothetical protein